MSKREHVSVDEVGRLILLSLAEGPKSFYDLVNRENIASPNTVLKALKNLENYMQIEKGEPEDRNRMPHKLTVFGLVRVFSDSDIEFDGSKLSECYSDLFPLILGKQELFKREGVFQELLAYFSEASGKEGSIVYKVMNEVDEDRKKLSRERIKKYPHLLSFIKTRYDGETLEEHINVLRAYLENEKKILNTDDKIIKAEKIQKAKEYYKNSGLDLVDRITRETLFSFKMLENFPVKHANTSRLYSSLIINFDTQSKFFKIYNKDEELRGFFTSYLEDHVSRSYAHFKAVSKLKGEWDALIKN